tara:strand:+ start:311 stop:2014 length:1704 start_codon:yes stop_codon:yes gene_type:complete
MLSVSGKIWKEISINKRIINKVKHDTNFSDLVSKIIISRKFNHLELLSISNSIDLINPFSKVNDFQKSKEILSKSIKNNEKILIIGDYDVDGCISTSLLINFFKTIKKDAEYYIPNRFTDGYGASLRLVKKLINRKPDLIIMLDCGSNSTETIAFLNSKKIKTIIIDHHEIYRPYPKSNSLINPKKDADYKKYDYLCTSSLVYFLIDSFLDKKIMRDMFEKNLIYVVLATICDVMPLRGLNRIIAIKVFRDLKKYDFFLFSKILQIKKIKRPLNIEDFAFIIGPIINSAGRINDANKIVKLLTTDINVIKDKILNEIICDNEKRKKIERNFIKELNLDQISKIKDNVLILHKNICNEGIIGIIASRLKEMFNKPSVVLTRSDEFYKASARSTLGFNFGKYIKYAIDKNLILDGGGHNMAAGFTIKKEKINEFKEYINSSFKDKKKYEIKEYFAKVSLNAINNKFYNDIKMLEPFGAFNENPFFLIEKVKILRPKIIKDSYISFYVKSKTGKLLPSISFNLLDSDISRTILYYKNNVNLIVQIKDNIWNNKKNLQLMVIDMITDLNKA